MNTLYIPGTTIYKKLKYSNLYKGKVVIVSNNKINSIISEDTYKNKAEALEFANNLIKELDNRE